MTPVTKGDLGWAEVNQLATSMSLMGTGCGMKP
jgi:hypothetical protein